MDMSADGCDEDDGGGGGGGGRGNEDLLLLLNNSLPLMIMPLLLPLMVPNRLSKLPFELAMFILRLGTGGSLLVYTSD